MNTGWLRLRWLGLFRYFPAFDVGRSAFSFLDLVVLFAHKSLYFPIPIRLFSANMKSRFVWFNAYLALFALAVGAGCKSAEERKRAKTYATFRLHLEVNPDASGRHQEIEISGAQLTVSDAPFLDEGNLDRAAVVDTVDGGYAVQVQYDRHGTLVLEGVTTAHRGRRIAVFTEFGVGKSATARWLAAPIIGRRLADGVFIFTPNATREEANEIVLGLNNIARKIKKKTKF